MGLSRDRSFLLTSSRLGDRASRRLPAACVHVPCMSWCSVPPRFSPGADRHSPCPSLSFPFHGRSLIAPTVTVCSTVAGMPRPRATCVDSARAAPTACCSFAPLGPPWCPCLLSPPWPRYRFVCATRRSTASHRRRAETRGAVSFVVFPFAPSSSSCCRPLLPRWLVCRPAGRVCSHALGFHSRPFHRSVPGGAVAVLAAFVFSPHSGGAAAPVPSTHRPPPSPAPFFPPHRLSVHPFRLGRCGFVPHQEGGADNRRRACDARSPYATG